MNTFEAQAEETALQLVGHLRQEHQTIILAESCTAGLVSDLMARVSGASAVLWGSFVCYTAEAKMLMLNIDREFLNQHGLVSRQTARKMADHALDLAGTSVAAAVTGLAGPLGDGSSTPVGTVWVAVAYKGEKDRRYEKEMHFDGTRAEVRMQAALAVLKALLDVVASG